MHLALEFICWWTSPSIIKMRQPPHTYYATHIWAISELKFFLIGWNVTAPVIPSGPGDLSDGMFLMAFQFSSSEKDRSSTDRSSGTMPSASKLMALLCRFLGPISCYIYIYSTPSIPLCKHLKLSNAKIVGMGKDACALPFVSTQVWDSRSRRGARRGGWELA